MSRRSESIQELSASIAERHWGECKVVLYRVLYGVPSAVALPITVRVIERYLPKFESHFPNVTWPRELLHNPQQWVSQYGRALPDSPESDRLSDARFIFSLDALLLGWTYYSDVSILTSSCACGIAEAIGAITQEAAGEEANRADLEECEGCRGTAKKKAPPPHPEAPIEHARSREWQYVLDLLVTQKVDRYPDVEPKERMDADFAEWQSRAMLLLVPLPTISDY